MTNDPMQDNFSGNDEIDRDALSKPLTEDNSTPFGPPDAANGEGPETSGQLDPTHPATDSSGDIDVQQLYDEGLAAAAEAVEPRATEVINDYNPDENEQNNA